MATRISDAVRIFPLRVSSHTRARARAKSWLITIVAHQTGQTSVCHGHKTPLDNEGNNPPAHHRWTPLGHQLTGPKKNNTQATSLESKPRPPAELQRGYLQGNGKTTTPLFATSVSILRYSLHHLYHGPRKSSKFRFFGYGMVRGRNGRRARTVSVPCK